MPNLRTGDEPQDLFDAIVEAYMEHRVTISAPEDFDFTYSVVVVSPELQEASLVADNERNGGVEFLKVSMTDNGEALEAFACDVEYGTTFIGNVFGVRET